MKTPDIKHNPQPKMRYELTLTIHDAPAPFESVSGYMQYEVTDKHCSPENPLSGTWNPPFKDVPIVFARKGDNVYIGTVYLDLLRDEDYYGLGVCHWVMVGATVEMKAYGITFTPHISADKIAGQQSLTAYFAKEHFADPTAKGMYFGGVPKSDWTAEQPEIFFSTMLTAKEHLE